MILRTKLLRKIFDQENIKTVFHIDYPCFNIINFLYDPILDITVDILFLYRISAAATGIGWLAKGHTCKIEITKLYLLMIFNCKFN